MHRNYDDPVYKAWRLKVYQRDKFKCQWPGCFASKKQLNAHHIKRWSDCPGLRYEIDNGITLCKNHHKMIQGMESYYEASFFKIVSSKKEKEKDE